MNGKLGSAVAAGFGVLAAEAPVAESSAAPVAPVVAEIAAPVANTMPDYEMVEIKDRMRTVLEDSCRTGLLAEALETGLAKEAAVKVPDQSSAPPATESLRQQMKVLLEEAATTGKLREALIKQCGTEEAVFTSPAAVVEVPMTAPAAARKEETTASVVPKDALPVPPAARKEEEVTPSEAPKDAPPVPPAAPAPSPAPIEESAPIAQAAPDAVAAKGPPEGSVSSSDAGEALAELHSLHDMTEVISTMRQDNSALREQVAKLAEQMTQLKSTNEALVDRVKKQTA